MSLRQHEIAEAGHRILNPLTPAGLALLADVAGVGPGTTILDLACGKGELLATWASAHGSSGVGVDLSPVFLSAARERAAQLGVADCISFVEGDAAAYLPAPEGFDIVSCLGATWIGGGVAGTLALMRRSLRAGGLLLVGEPFWSDPPPVEALTAMGLREGEFVSLGQTLDRFLAADVEPVEAVFADGQSWDRYEAGQWRTVAAWLDANPGDPMHAEMRAFLENGRHNYLWWGRRYLGWGVFVLRAR